MSDEVIQQDGNRVKVLCALTSDESREVKMLRVNPVTGRLLVTTDNVLDEDSMVSNSYKSLATQQSIKAFGSHDRQLVVDQASYTTSSNSFVDLTNATITAKNLMQVGTYLGSFSVLLSPNVANTTATFRTTVNDIPVGTERAVILKTNAADVGFTFLTEVTGVVSGDTIKVQWKTDKGTIAMTEFNIAVDGIPEARVI